MALSEEDKIRIREERELLIPALQEPGVQLLFKKLQDEALRSGNELKKINFLTQQYRAIYLQCFLDLVEGEIPRIFENIVNIDRIEEIEPVKWSFRRWLISKLEDKKGKNTQKGSF